MTSIKRHNPKKPNQVAQDAFIAEYFANGGRKKAACEKLGIGWTTCKDWFVEDPAFVKRVEEFRDFWRENLRAQAIKRGMEKSDVLLMFMLKSLDPETYDDTTRHAKWMIDHDIDIDDGARIPNIIFVSEEAPPQVASEPEPVIQ
jgi:hypothetical protein